MIDYAPGSGRKAHIWRFRRRWYRQHLISHGWTMCGAYASRFLGGQLYMVTIVRKTHKYIFAKFHRKSDFWSPIIARERDQSALENRKQLQLVSTKTLRRGRSTTPPLAHLQSTEGLKVPLMSHEALVQSIKAKHPDMNTEEIEEQINLFW